MSKKVEYLVVDTTAFIQNTPLQNIAKNVVTTQSVVDEIRNKRQLRRLVVLPYDLVIKDVFPENIKVITEFAKKTGDYPALSATDIGVMALTYQLEKEMVGIEHLRSEPLVNRVNVATQKKDSEEPHPDVTGFYAPPTLATDEGNEDDDEIEEEDEEAIIKHIEQLKLNDKEDSNVDDILVPVKNSSDEGIESEDEEQEEIEVEEDEDEEQEEDDDEGWITPKNVQKAKEQLDSDLLEDKETKVACITTDFAMQNVLKQMNLNVCSLDGRLIKQLRTFILRCYTCFKTTSLMDKMFCPKCGNNTLKRVAISLDQNGQQVIHINGKKPLTARGKKFSLPTIKGGKHSNNPILVADQPMPDQKSTRLARMKNNPLNDDYIAGYSPFIMRDVNSKSAILKIRPDNTEVKHWMRKNPNEARRKRK